MVPNGWKQSELGTVFDFKNGLNTDKEKYGRGYKFVNVMDVFGNSILTEEKIIGRVEVLEKQLKEYQLKYGDVYWSSRAGHFYLRIFILQWTHSIVGCMRPFKIVITNELRDFLFNSVFIHGRSVT